MCRENFFLFTHPSHSFSPLSRMRFFNIVGTFSDIFSQLIVNVTNFIPHRKLFPHSKAFAQACKKLE